MPIATRTEHFAAGPADPEADAVLRPPWPAIDVTPEEIAAGRALYVHLEAAKSVRRGRGDPAASDAARRALEDALRRGGVSAGWERLARRALAL